MGTHIVRMYDDSVVFEDMDDGRKQVSLSWVKRCIDRSTTADVV